MLKSDTMSTRAASSVYPWFAFSGVLFVLDQWSKWWVVKHITIGEFINMMPSLALTLTYNAGIAFSLFSQKALLGKIILLVFVGVISATIAFWLAKTPATDKWNRAALALILGGALGNLCDRLVYGHVVDFIDCYYQNWHWYTFNLADCFITVGALMTIKALIFSKETEE